MWKRVISGLVGKSITTEGRSSIRESVRVFSVIEEHCERNLKEPQLFERLVSQGRRENPSPFPEKSCGLTNSSFASLFFSSQQLLDNSISLHTNGSSLEQLCGNLNVVLFGMGLIGGRKSSSLLTRYFVGAATNQVHALEDILVRPDEEESLPRVFFCNASWVLDDVKIVKDTHESNYVKDHQFTIIKHSNDNFQCIQGYKQTHQTDLNGFCLSGWQQSQSRYSSRKGFSLQKMRSFTEGLQAFAAAVFNSKSFEGLFGVFETSSNGQNVLPCFSFRELEDNGIEGCGDRVVCNRVANNIRS